MSPKLKKAKRRQRLLTISQFELVKELLCRFRRKMGVADYAKADEDLNELLVVLEVAGHCLLPCGVIEAMKSALERATEHKG